jgi:hypothetical protein
MRKKVLLFGTLATMLSVLTIAQVLNKKNSEPVEEVSKVDECKTKTREKLKPYRYDGTKITHFNYLKYDQTKEVEILLFNGNEYKLCFNAEQAPVGISIKIYDISKEAAGNYPEKRKLLKTIENFKGDQIVESNVLNEEYRKLKENPKLSLKRVFVEYTIPEAEYVKEQLPPKSKEEPKMVPQKGFCVLTYGYKNI